MPDILHSHVTHLNEMGQDHMRTPGLVRIAVVLITSGLFTPAYGQRAVDEQTKRAVEEQMARLQAAGGNPTATLDFRVEQLEAENRKLRADVDALRKEVERLKANQPSPPVTDQKAATPTARRDDAGGAKGAEAQLVTCRLLKKGFRPMNIEAGELQEAVTFSLRFTNNSGKDIKALTGTLTFLDLFDREILSPNFTYEDGLKEGASADWDGGLKYNEFFDGHQRLRNVDQDKVQVKMKVKQVIYADGKREAFE